MEKKTKARVIALYLPQFHPIPENDEWWGKGFTEWINVAKAKPLFKGHYQPRIPADLGFYDLRMHEVREAQAKMAHEAGIEGFCYWQYYFGNGKQLLETPFNEVLESRKPDFPFCLGWANHSWSNKSWEKKSKLIKDRLLEEQLYSEQDYIEHFYKNLKAFKDKRYIKIDDKPLFLVFNPLEIPDASNFIQLWRNLAVQNGLKGIHFVGVSHNASFRDSRKLKDDKLSMPNLNDAASFYNHVLEMGFDAVNSRGQFRAQIIIRGKYKKAFQTILKKVFNIPLLDKYEHKDILKHLYVDEDKWENVYPTLLPNWDRSPRAGKGAAIYTNSTPELFKKNIERGLDLVKNKSEEHKILFLQSWNEWGEGNYVEPDLKYGRGFIDVISNTLIK